MTVRRVALTGGIATGKSYCLARFRDLGAPVIDADRLAHDVLAPGSPALARVTARFGVQLVDAAGRLDRTALGNIVFADAGARQVLEAIVHPAVYEAIGRWFADLEAAAQPPPAGIADIPLLFETGREGDFDRVIVAACRPDQQIERLLARRGMSRRDAELRIAAQMPIDEKVGRADVVIDTSRTLDETDRQVEAAWADLRR